MRAVPILFSCSVDRPALDRRRGPCAVVGVYVPWRRRPRSGVGTVNGGPHRRRPNVTVHLGGTGRSQPRRHHRPGPSETAPASATSGAEAARDCRQGRWRPVTRSVRVLHLTLSVSLPHCLPPTSYAGSVASYSPSLARRASRSPRRRTSMANGGVAGITLRTVSQPTPVFPLASPRTFRRTVLLEPAGLDASSAGMPRCLVRRLTSIPWRSRRTSARRHRSPPRK